MNFNEARGICRMSPDPLSRRRWGLGTRLQETELQASSEDLGGWNVSRDLLAAISIVKTGQNWQEKVIT